MTQSQQFQHSQLLQQSPDSPLLRQLQQRFVKLAHIDDSDAPAVRQLLAELFQAQQSGNGVLKLTDLTLDTPIEALRARANGLIGDVGSDAPITIFPPFIAFRRVYLQLFHVSSALRERRAITPPSTDALNHMRWQFQGGDLSDEQRLAVLSCASLDFAIITGGAGTGKTTTLTKALELILLDNPETDIFLATPTGKAAQRLNESLALQLDCVDEAVKPRLSQLQAISLHRLLGVSERTGKAYKNADNPLTCQVLAIDEASMIGSDLLAQVFEALPREAKLILLGDANQLPPIHSVAFFNEMSQLQPTYTPDFSAMIVRTLSLDMSHAEAVNAPLANHICRLSASKRFAEQSLIERCANAVLARDAETLLQALGADCHSIRQAKHLYAQLADSYPSEPDALKEALTQRMILCANRQGELGSEAINAHLDRVFRQRLSNDRYSQWYAGRQILIEKNHFDLQLSNGDIGRCFAHQGEWYIDFGDERTLAVDVLPNDYSLAFAITIHKSQGSEYAHVDMVLDRARAETLNPLITPELLYTGITRAKQSITVFADAGILRACLQEQATREESPLLHLLKEIIAKSI